MEQDLIARFPHHCLWVSLLLTGAMLCSALAHMSGLVFFFQGHCLYVTTLTALAVCAAQTDHGFCLLGRVRIKFPWIPVKREAAILCTILLKTQLVQSNSGLAFSKVLGIPLHGTTS